MCVYIYILYYDDEIITNYVFVLRGALKSDAWVFTVNILGIGMWWHGGRSQIINQQPPRSNSPGVKMFGLVKIIPNVG